VNSIRTRLLLWLLSAVVAGGLSAAITTYQSALTAADQVFDEQLQQTATSLRDQAFEFALPPQLPASETRNNVVVQVWSPPGVRVYLSEFYKSLPGLQRPGFSNVRTDEGEWRVFALPSRGYVVQVAQPIAVRKKRAAGLAAQTLLPFALMLPVLGVAIWLIVGAQLKPLENVAASVRERQADALEPLPEAFLPDEVKPLVGALNGLLGRLRMALEVQQEFVADAAHELRTPLTAIRLQLQLAERAADPAERAAAFRDLKGGVDRTVRLVEQLLTLARQEAAPAAQESVSIDELAREVVAGLAPIADSRAQDLGLSDAVPATVHGDPNALRTLLRNLVDNACRYTPEGGRIDVSVGAADGAPFLRVTDTGPGIPARDRERVFDRFYRRIGSEVPGTGLGLAIVQSIARSHRAAVELADNPAGPGLQATVRFPRPG
jgi:two-component system OmpR family sensor kinase